MKHSFIHILFAFLPKERTWLVQVKFKNVDYAKVEGTESYITTEAQVAVAPACSPGTIVNFISLPLSDNDPLDICTPILLTLNDQQCINILLNTF